MRSSTIISIVVALVVAIAAVVLSASYLRGEREAAIRSAQDQAVEKKPQLMVVVAAKTIAFGEKLTLNKLDQVPWYSDDVPQGLFTSFDVLVPGVNNEDLTRHAMTSFQVGEPIHEARITKAGEVAKLSATITPGYKAVSIRVNDVLGVAGFVLPGDHVDVLLTRNTKGKAFVDVLLQSVKVLAIDQQADNRADQPSVVRTVTFEVNTLEAQKLTLGASVGVLSLTLRNIESTGAEHNRRISMDVLGSTGTSSSGVDSPKSVDIKSSSTEEVPNIKQVQLQRTERTTNKTTKTVIKPIFYFIGVTRGRGDRQEYRVVNEEHANEYEAGTN
jgi:pilus assembly protein CpaB